MKMANSIIRKLIPEKVYDSLVLIIKYSGWRYACPCCNGRFRKLKPAGQDKKRENAQCPKCGSMERHRLLILYLRNKTRFFQDKLKVLDIAPMDFFQKLCKSSQNLDYTSADMESPLAMMHFDISEIPLPDNSFDCIICYHVLEHVPDDTKAMKELYRVLKPGGWAILQVPIDQSREKTFEDPSVTSPEERLKLFGQKDHVRIYGVDYKNRLENAGFKVRLDTYLSELSVDDKERYRLPQKEDIHFCIKQ